VLIEAAFVLERVLRIPRASIASALSEFVAFPFVQFDFRESILRAIDLWKMNGPLSLPDAYHLVFAKDRGLDRIYTFDKKMNRYPGIERIEP
jgi:predicted nucleic acid-binding protein